MVTVIDLQAQVASRFELLDLPEWVNPHPNMASPRAQEYSRVTDPERWRVVHSRARLWAAVLEDILGAHTETLVSGSGAPDDYSRTFDRGVRLTSRRPGALPLLLLERDVPTLAGGATLAVLDIEVGDLGVRVASLPDCGCDACDCGSSDLLGAVDSTIGHVVGGPFVVLRGKKWRAQWHPGGGSASSEGRGPDFTKVMDLCRRLAEGETVRLPRHTEALVGRSWLS
ncbi:DUF6226 family protein [Pengzhenrongella phosphoraccumulans]|uniref:DUF6226 family protein n=1 Tax=Pengzhenrongella phosphoraccumulans TaxID=3114394 RepID=UPI0038902226